MFPITSTEQANRFYTNLIQALKCSIGQERIYTLLREIQKVYLLVLESKYCTNYAKLIRVFGHDMTE